MLGPAILAGRIFAAKDDWAPEYRELGDIFQGVKAVDWNPPPPEVGPRKVIVAGWCGKVGDLTASLTMFAPRGTSVTMICECAPEASRSFPTCLSLAEVQSARVETDRLLSAGDAERTDRRSQFFPPPRRSAQHDVSRRGGRDGRGCNHHRPGR